jgi:hypothetical protein
MIVIFRIDPPSQGGGVFALFPEDPADFSGRLCTSYEHVGQHCEANYNSCMARSRPATPSEYASLLGELRTIGYKNIVIRQRATAEMHDRRRAAAKAIQ